MKVKLRLRPMNVEGRNGYYALDADGGCANIGAFNTRKLANSIMGYINQGVSEFCKLNRLAHLFLNLEILKYEIAAIATDSQDAKCRAAAFYVAKWLQDHRKEDGEDEAGTAYLSIHQEQIADEREAVKAVAK